jgi:diguanylate cyclase (GGDEF)-like protein
VDQRHIDDQAGSELEAARKRIVELETLASTLRETQRALAIQNRIVEIFLTVPDDEMYGDVLHVALEATASPFGTFGYIDTNGLVVPSMTRQVWRECRMEGKTTAFPRDTWTDSIWARAIREKRTLFSNEPSMRTPEGHIRILKSVATPIIHRGNVIGILHVANKALDYNEDDVRLLGMVAGAVAPVLDARLRRDREEAERRRVEVELRQSAEREIVLARARDEFRSMVLVDDLTGALNRRGLMTFGARQLALAQRMKFGLWLLFADVDGMKHINDSLGHQVGDKALIETAETLKSSLRQTDVVARIGGDEFAAINVDATRDGIETIVRRLSANIEARNAQPGRAYRLSLSFGAAYFDPNEPCALEALLGEADRKMYEQKRGGPSSAFLVRPH